MSSTAAGDEDGRHMHANGLDRDRGVAATRSTGNGPGGKRDEDSSDDRRQGRPSRPVPSSPTIDGKVLEATLLDNPTARDFLSLLPITLTLEDYASTEKISYLPRKLSTAGAPAGVDPAEGDITYYAPWGNLAIFYKDFGYAKGLIKLGSLDSGVEMLSTRGALKVTIEALGK